MGTQFTLPPATRAIGTGNPPADMDNVINAVASAGVTLNALNQAYSGGADPTGGTDSTAAIQAALTACPAGSAVYLPPGTYVTSSPLTIPPQVGLTGSLGTATVGEGAGTVIMPSSSFSAGVWPVQAVVLIVDATTGNYSGTSEEQHVSDIKVDGANLAAAGNVTGFYIYNGGAQVRRTSFRNCLAINMTGWGFACPTLGLHIRALNVQTRNCGTNNSLNAGGFQVKASDSRWLMCSAFSCFGDGWQITDSWDSTFVQCHAEHSTSSAAYGFNFTADDNNSLVAVGGLSFAGCSVDGGQNHGVHFTSTTTTNLPPVTWSGGYVRRPGESAATFAGFFIDAYMGPVNIEGAQVYPGQPDGGGSNHPQFAVKVANCGATTNVAITGGTLIGTTAFLSCDGSQGSLTVSGDTTIGSGIGTNTLAYTPGVALQAVLSAELLPADTTLYRQPANCLATTHDRNHVNTSFTPASGIPTWHLVTLVAGVPITNLVSWVTGTVKATGTHGWVAIANVSAIPGVAAGKIVAVSADQTDAATTWGTANAAQPIALASPYTPPVTGAYWLGVSITATTMPTLATATGPDTNIASQAPIMCGTSASQTTPPAVGAAGGPTSGVASDSVWMYAT